MNPPDHNQRWSLAFMQLLAARQADTERFRRFNPRPAGVIRKGSVTHGLFEHMAESPGRIFESRELQMILGAQRGSVSFSLHWLTRRGLVEVLEDPRNPRYQLYRLASGAHAEVSVRPAGDCASQVSTECEVRDAKAVHGPPPHQRIQAWTQRRAVAHHAEVSEEPGGHIESPVQDTPTQTQHGEDR